MATIAEQLAGLAVTHSLKVTGIPASFTKLPWSEGSGTWSETNGWSPASFGSAYPVHGDRSGAYYNTTKQKGGAASVVTWDSINGSLINERQLSAWLHADITDASADGYQVIMYQTSSSTSAWTVKLRKYVAGEGSTLGEVTNVTMEVGGAFAVVVVNGKVSAWVKKNSSEPFALIGSEVADTTFTEGYAGIGGNGSNPRLANFRIGAITTATEDTAHRYFTGTSETDGEYLGTALGNFGGESARTVVALVKWDGQRGNILGAEEAAGLGGTDRILLSLSNLGDVQYVERTGGTVQVVEDEWYLIVGQKAAGTQKPKVHSYRFSTKTWQHGEASEARGEQNPSGWNHFRIGGRVNTVGPYRGGIAAIAGYKSVLSEEQLQTLVNSVSIENWLSISPTPSILWMFNQVSVEEELEDLSGGGGNQTERSGTSVVDEEPPIPYYGAALKAVKVFVGGVIKEVTRWVMMPNGQLVNK